MDKTITMFNGATVKIPSHATKLRVSTTRSGKSVSVTFLGVK